MGRMTVLRFFAAILFGVAIFGDNTETEWLALSVAGWLCLVGSAIVDAIKEASA
ncbi:hypothetical protein [Sphingopyxis sp. JAI128]|uniref:hypothetical protein n=1 Tax=Sphingopyxis sp. JAI128 TaxID=2723066 RepID=UPI00162202FA|nr:hypothetical protein [Sphingopyxis sp. JAI128]MBB6424987.1 hypothetical protein [Sphingopyxis sp. JAI128]